MVEVHRDRIYSEEDPLHITAGKVPGGARTAVPVSADVLDSLLDVMERIQDQLGLITGVNLAEGERFR